MFGGLCPPVETKLPCALWGHLASGRTTAPDREAMRRIAWHETPGTLPRTFFSGTYKQIHSTAQCMPGGFSLLTSSAFGFSSFCRLKANVPKQPSEGSENHLATHLTLDTKCLESPSGLSSASDSMAEKIANTHDRQMLRLASFFGTLQLHL